MTSNYSVICLGTENDAAVVKVYSSNANLTLPEAKTE